MSELVVFVLRILFLALLWLFILFIGLKTDQNIRNELVLEQRWGLLAAVVIAVMAVRFVTIGRAVAKKGFDDLLEALAAWGRYRP